LPVVAAIGALPILVHRLGADRFGVLTLAWAIAGYFSLFDFGLGRALTKAMARELSRTNRHAAATLFWTTLAMMLVFGAAAGFALWIVGPWLVGDVLTIPLALRPETIAGLDLIAAGLPILVSISALRAALSAAERFDLLNLIRLPSGIMSFVAPVILLPLTHSIEWMIAALIVNRAVSWFAYVSVVTRALPGLTSSVNIDPACAPSLLGFGAWITVAAIITPITLYLDRFLIGALISVAALAAYSIPMEIIAKSFIVPAAVSGVMFPAFARAFVNEPTSLSALFARALKLVAVVLFPACVGVVTFAPQIMSLWIGSRYATQTSAVLQLLAVGALITGLAWIPVVLLHAAHRPDLPAKIHLIDFPIYALMLWAGIRQIGLAGAALAWSTRLLAESAILFAMASRYLTVTRREMFLGSAVLFAAIAVMAAGALMTALRSKAIFVIGIDAACVFCSWRFLLNEAERARIANLLPAGVRLSPAKAVN